MISQENRLLIFLERKMSQILMSAAVAIGIFGLADDNFKFLCFFENNKYVVISHENRLLIFLERKMSQILMSAAVAVGIFGLKGGCTGSSESTLFKMPHCWK